MSAFDELRRTGRFGPDGTKMLYATMRAVGSRRGFPPPEGYDTWDGDAAITAAHEFLVHKRTKARMTDLAVKATDDDSLGRLLAKAVWNYLRDLGRATEVGRLVLRINDVLSSDERFVRSQLRAGASPEAHRSRPPSHRGTLPQQQAPSNGSPCPDGRQTRGSRRSPTRNRSSTCATRS